jgi:ClpP protease-like protein
LGKYRFTIYGSDRNRHYYSLPSLFANLFSQIQRMPLEVSTYNISTVQSIAITLFCAGRRRYCVPEATFMIHPVLFQSPRNQYFRAQQFREFF